MHLLTASAPARPLDAHGAAALLLAVYHGGTAFWVISEILLLGLAGAGYYRWKGPHAYAKTPAALARYRQGTILAVLFALIVAVRLATHTYR